MIMTECSVFAVRFVSLIGGKQTDPPPEAFKPHYISHWEPSRGNTVLTTPVNAENRGFAMLAADQGMHPWNPNRLPSPAMQVALSIMGVETSGGRPSHLQEQSEETRPMSIVQCIPGTLALTAVARLISRTKNRQAWWVSAAYCKRALCDDDDFVVSAPP
jgi:hypothetical protein